MDLMVWEWLGSERSLKYTCHLPMTSSSLLDKTLFWSLMDLAMVDLLLWRWIAKTHHWLYLEYSLSPKFSQDWIWICSALVMHSFTPQHIGNTRGSALFLSQTLQATLFASIVCFTSWFHQGATFCHLLPYWDVSVHIPKQLMKLNLFWTATTPLLRQLLEQGQYTLKVFFLHPVHHHLHPFLTQIFNMDCNKSAETMQKSISNHWPNEFLH